MLSGVRALLTRLRPMRVPEAPARDFRDLWPGDPARGARLLRGELEVEGTVRQFEGWSAADGPLAWRAAAQSFAWMRDLRTLGTDAARVHARDLVEDWLARGAAEPLAALPEIAAGRICALLGHWDFVAATAEEAFRRRVLASLLADARAVVAGLPAESAHRGALVVMKASIAAAVAFEEEAWLTRALRFLPAELERQFHPDGGHVERSPQAQMLAAQDLVEIRNLLNGVGLDAPPTLASAIERAGSALRLFRHADQGLALFNGTREEPGAIVDLVLTHAQARGRAPMLLEETGFHRLAAGRTLVIADCGVPPPGRAPHPGTGQPRGGDRFAHAGTLSFEMSVGRDRLIVNCGASPASEPAWRDALRATAAHSTLVLADTNSSEVRDEGLGRRPERVEVERHEMNGAQWLDASHDGWRRTHGVVHRRRLYLSEGGDDLRGEDMLEPPGTTARPFVLRFHLHPGVSASLLEDGGVLLRLPGGQGWRLRARGAEAALEDSLYAGGEPRRSLQVVLTAEVGAETVQWALSRIPQGGIQGANGPQPAAEARDAE